MSAKNASEKTKPANGGTPVSGMTPVHFGFLGMGVRISQLLMLHQLAETDVYGRGPALVTLDIMIRQAYSFLASAFERLAQALALSQQLTQRGHEIIAEGSNSWKSCTKEDADNLGDTVLCLGELESLIRDVSALLGRAGAKARDWFELGLMVPEGEGDDTLPYEDRVWTWNDAERIDQQLALLGMRHEAIFPDTADLESITGWIILPGRFSGWNNIEAGLMQLASTVVPDESAAKDDILQLRVPEIAKYLFGSEIYEASRDSSDRLVRKWIQEGRIPAQRVKHGLYAVRTSHLKILKDIHR